MGLPWVSHGSPVGVPFWFIVLAHGYPIDLPCVCYGSPMGLWGWLMLLSRVCHGFIVLVNRSTVVYGAGPWVDHGLHYWPMSSP